MQSRTLQAAAVALVLAAVAYTFLLLKNPYNAWQLFEGPLLVQKHPIDYLISAANARARAWQQNAPSTVPAAAAAYRARRGRHPPPRFDKWVAYAQARDSPINEEFFDQIYEDLDPFWGVDPRDIRYKAQTFKQSISIRNGFAVQRNDSIYIAWDWLKNWMGAIKEIEHELPDVDMAFNNVDEPRVIVPWETMDALMQASQASKHTRRPGGGQPVVNEYTSYPVIAENPPLDKYNWTEDADYWFKMRVACAPDSPGRRAGLDIPFNATIDFDALLQEDPRQAAYVHNVTSARNVCEHPELRYLHGAYIWPGSPDVTHDLFPLFSGCKVSGIHNDILVPAAEYFAHMEAFTGGSDEQKHVPWERKKAFAIWRGRATGGMSNDTTFRHYHRHRLVATMNATQVALTERAKYARDLSEHDRAVLRQQTAENIYLPSAATYPLAAMQSSPTTFGVWTRGLTDAGLTHLFCFPQGLAMFSPGTECPYLEPFYHKVDGIPMHEMFGYKFLPDVDGQSFSGRYRALLQSSSMPIKASVYAEWHDARLLPWHHYVPMDNTYKDWWTILEYFAGYDPQAIARGEQAHIGRRRDVSPASSSDDLARPAHDDQARAIAEHGMHWASQTMRRDDMVVYLYRLILEYARVCDDHRLGMGWTDDLVG